MRSVEQLCWRWNEFPAFKRPKALRHRRMNAPPLFGVPATTTPAPEAAGPRWESWAEFLILGVFAVVGLNHVHSNTPFGQDFLLHSNATEALLADPSKWFPQNFTNRPLIYWIGAFGHWLTHGKAPYEMAAVIFVLMNTLALHVAHATTRGFIASPWLRLAGISFIAFLPSTQVSVVVYAADAVSLFPFVLTIWGLWRSLEARSVRASAGYAAVAGLALCLGNFAKFSYVVLPVAVVLALILTCRAQRISGRRGLMIGALALIAPVLTGGWIHLQARRQLANVPPQHKFDWHGTGEMTWCDLLLVKASDRRIFDAPSYWDTELVKGVNEYALPLRHNYSYPALLHLAIYTDVLDYANQGQYDDGAPRPEPQKTLSRWAVRLGLLTTAAVFLALLAFLARSGLALVNRQRAPATGVLLWGLMALAWYLPLVLTFPYLHAAYESGYWLPRLVIPALWGFGLVAFAAADGLLARHRHWRALLAGLVFLQAAVHIRSVWF